MKIDRLIGILSILLQQEKVTAPYLAEKFEVSWRTINRDIEDLCKAGIPVVTERGQNGGISIMEGYRVDRALLTSSDMQSILAGLRSLDSVSGTNKYQQLMEKLSAGNSKILTSNSHIVIDLSSWYKSTLAPKIEQIQAAIERHENIIFTYYAPKGESQRVIEPYLLVFKWASWYVWGYCTEKEDFRMFKLNRLLNLDVTGDIFIPRPLPPFSIDNEKIFAPTFDAEILVKPEMKWRLIEEYGINSFTEQADGRLRFQGSFADKNSLFGWVLSFGGHAELVAPMQLRREFGEIIQNILVRYQKH